jgi:hypothetical protein
MGRVVYISDYFSDEITGGGELNDNELINIFLSKDIEILKLKSSNVNLSILKQINNIPIIISNFINLGSECITYLQDNCRYVIYEHDHKYIMGRNPAVYNNFIAPKEHIINFQFYKNAKYIFCQSSLHKNIIYNNLKLNNIINLSGNLWSINTLKFIENICINVKNNKYAILDSEILHKNKHDSIMFCKYKNYDYSLVKDNNHNSFLQKLSLNKGLVFFPKTPETLSRLCVEAKMLNLQLITNNNIGATYEEWFNLKGKELIDYCLQMRYNISNKVLESL